METSWLKACHARKGYPYRCLPVVRGAVTGKATREGSLASGDVAGTRRGET